MTELVFSRRFSMAHRLIHGPSEKCAVPHGHNEIVRVYLTSEHMQERLDGRKNMHVSFHQAKKTWHDFIDNVLDHSLQLSYDDPLLAWFIHHEPSRLSHIVVTPGDPTTELMTCLLMSKLEMFLKAEKQQLTCRKISIEETPTNTVSFQGCPRDFIPQVEDDGLRWWERDDMSISKVTC